LQKALATITLLPPGVQVRIDCNDLDVLQQIQRLTDGAKIRGVAGVLCHVLNLTKMATLAPLMDREYANEETIKAVKNVSDSIKHRVITMAECKQEYFGEVPFEYDYRGCFPVMKHQKVLFNCMSRINRCGILAEPGTCKTGPYLWSIDQRIKKKQIKRALIITLASVRENVLDEMSKQVPGMSGIILNGKDLSEKIIHKKYKKASMNRDYDVYIASYESMASLQKVIPRDFFNYVICDEAHRIGSPDTNQTNAIVEMFEFCKYKYIISGTLNANNYMSAFMPLRFLGVDMVPWANFYAFRDMYMYKKSMYSYEFHPKPELIELAPRMISRSCIFFAKSECMDLPPIIYSEMKMSMTGHQKEVYESLKKDLVATLKGLESVKETFNGEERPSTENEGAVKFSVKTAVVLLAKLHQVASGFLMETLERLNEDGDVDDASMTPDVIRRIYTFKENPKMDALMDWIREVLPKGKKLIIWATNIHAIDMICERLDKEKLGKHIKVYRDVDAFQAAKTFENTDVRFFVASGKKAGVGLNLQFSHYQAYYMNSFSYVCREQQEGRQHRGAQAENVNCVDFLVKDSVDLKIRSTLLIKKNISDSLNEFCSPSE
jgi:hypothetical protein